MGVEPMSALQWPSSTPCLVFVYTDAPLQRLNQVYRAALLYSLGLQSL
jgi:hypothetical protein